MDKFEYISEKGVIGTFFEMLDAGENSYVNDVMFPVDSSSASEKIAWLGATPTMRVMKNGRKVIELNEYELEIVNKEYEATMEFHRRDLRRDKTNQLQARIGSFADGVNDHWAELLAVAINNGASQLCYDGQYFFDTDHSEGDSGSHSNKISVDINTLPITNKGSITSPSASAMGGAIMAGVNKFYGYKDDQGRPINQSARDFMVMTPTNLWAPALAATGNAVVDGGDTNTIVTAKSKFNLDPVPNPRLTSTSKFYIFRKDGRVKPFIQQSEVPVEVYYLDEGSEFFKLHNRTQLGAYASRGLGYGMWQHAVEVTLTDSE